MRYSRDGLSTLTNPVCVSIIIHIIDTFSLHQHVSFLTPVCGQLVRFVLIKRRCRFFGEFDDAIALLLLIRSNLVFQPDGRIPNTYITVVLSLNNTTSNYNQSIQFDVKRQR